METQGATSNRQRSAKVTGPALMTHDLPVSVYQFIRWTNGVLTHTELNQKREKETQTMLQTQQRIEDQNQTKVYGDIIDQRAPPSVAVV